MNSTPEEIVKPSQSSSTDVNRLHEAREEVKIETAKVSRCPPRFSGDGRVALIRINSGAQVHPVSDNISFLSYRSWYRILNRGRSLLQDGRTRSSPPSSRSLCVQMTGTYLG